MLKIAAALTLTLLACLAPAAHAQEKGNDAGLCKSVCASARQECRAHVQQATQDDTSPALTMKPSSNPYVAAGRDAAPQSQQLRPTQAEAFAPAAPNACKRVKCSTAAARAAAARRP